MEADVILMTELREVGYCETQQYCDIIKWFVNEHHINIYADCGAIDEWIWTINFIDKRDYVQSDDLEFEKLGLEPYYKTIDEALTEGIVKALSYIKK